MAWEYQLQERKLSVCSTPSAGDGQDVELSSLRQENQQPSMPVARRLLKTDHGFRYHDNWLHNLLIAGSMNGR